MTVLLSEPRKLVLRAALNGDVALHDAMTGHALAGQCRVELVQEKDMPAKIIVEFEVGESVTLGERQRVMARGESGPAYEVAGQPHTRRMPKPGRVIAKCLDLLAVALASHNHVWSDEERRAYEASVALLASGDLPGEQG